jgi:hypothetical protein
LKQHVPPSDVQTDTEFNHILLGQLAEEVFIQEKYDLHSVANTCLVPATSHGQLDDDWTASEDVDILEASEQLEAAEKRSIKTAVQAYGLHQSLGEDIPAASSSSSSRQDRWGDHGHAISELTSVVSTERVANETTAEPSTVLQNELAAAAAASGKPSTPSSANNDVGSFFSSRAYLLQELQHQQFLQQRQYMLLKRRKSMYKYTLSSDENHIVIAAGPGPRSPLQQEEFGLAKRRLAAPSDSDTGSSQDGDDNNSTMGDGDSRGISSQGEVLASSDGPLTQQQQQQLFPLQHEELMPQLEQLQHLHAATTRRSSRSSNPSPRFDGTAFGQQAAAPDGRDPSKGLRLSAFLYCCSRSKLLQLTWQLGLPTDALSFVTRVADADMVLHVKPRPGERHYQYDDVSGNAAAAAPFTP